MKRMENPIPKPSLDIPAGWSEEDAQWLAAIQPPQLQGVAKQHGRKLYAITWQAGMLSEGLGQLAIHTQNISKWGMKRDVQGLMRCLQVMQAVGNTLIAELLHAHQLSMEQFRACKADIERTMSLAQPMPPANEAGGRIILP